LDLLISLIKAQSCVFRNLLMLLTLLISAYEEKGNGELFERAKTAG
jgi:hypothetical protein